MHKFKAVIEHATFYDIAMEREALGRMGVEVVDIVETGADIRKEAVDADAIMIETETIDRDIIYSTKKCKIIAVYATGYDNIDVKAATEKGIFVTNAGNYCSEEVQDHTLALIMASVRKLFMYSQAVKSGNWEQKLGRPVRSLLDLKDLGVPIKGIPDTTLGIFGFGRIGRGLCRKARCIGFKVIAHDPLVPEDQIIKEGAMPVSFEELLERSDVISIHAPLTEETKHKFSYNEFKKMKKTAILVNASRGAILDEAALIKALKEGEIQAAALDVLAEENPPSEDNPLFKLDNVIVTPHCAFYSERSQMELRRRILNQAMQALRGEVPDNLVNREVLAKLGVK
ncbi:MAG: C-terminal binding protein [Candidatus Hadarchaeum sp.]